MDFDEIDKDMGNISIDLSKSNPRKPSPDPKSTHKPKYTSDNLDEFKVKKYFSLYL